MRPHKITAIALSAFLAVLSTSAHAVYLNADGLGQALIYPYYTARSAQGNAFNTYISVVNTDFDTAKLLRVRFREGVDGREVAGFNLFLGPADMWAAAVVPTARGARLLTADRSCVDPPLAQSSGQPAELVFDDGGAVPDSTREGYVEIIEMAMAPMGTDTFEALSPVYIYPRDCDFVRNAANVMPDLRTPTGALMGTLTLINVMSGEDFTVTADALADLATQQFFRAAADPYPDFNVAEVTPRSRMLVGGKAYDLQWASGVEAVSSVLMASQVLNEYIMDRGTASQTDWVLTYPTRRYFPDPLPLFALGPQGNLLFLFSDRVGRAAENYRCSFIPLGPCYQHHRLGAVNVLAITPGNATPASLLGSTRVLPGWVSSVPDYFESGWIQVTHTDDVFPDPGPLLESLPNSKVFDLDTGTTTSGSFAVKGLPVTGLALRTFRNGTLSCSGTSCQGNYGGSFSHRYRREIVPAP